MFKHIKKSLQAYCSTCSHLSSTFSLHIIWSSYFDTCCWLHLGTWWWFSDWPFAISSNYQAPRHIDVKAHPEKINENNKKQLFIVIYYCQTQKTVNTWKISGMLIVYWPITIKFRTCEQTSKPQTNYRCCLWFSYLAPYWLISRNTITFHKYFWCSRFCEFHSKEDQQLSICRLNGQVTIYTENLKYIHLSGSYLTGT